MRPPMPAWATQGRPVLISHPTGNPSTVKWVFVFAFLASAVYVHLRGKVRHRLGRQLLDHSTFMAPINVLMYAFSRVPTTPFIDEPGRHFPELEPLRRIFVEAATDQLFE